MVSRISIVGRLAAVVALFVTLAIWGGGNPARADITAATVDAVAPGPIYAVFPGHSRRFVPAVHVAVLGDSYTYAVGASERTDGFAYRVAGYEHWSADVIGLAGSGYVRVSQRDNLRISAGIADVIAAQPQVVIVECGHNDVDTSVMLAHVEPAALKDLRALRAGLPNATIVVVGPVWLSSDAPHRVYAVRDAIHAAQRQIPGSLWIDPIAEHWFTGHYSPAISERTGDDVTMINYRVGHPNDLGYQHMADLLEGDLRTLGVS
jgi:lysophospholipase L1-like esterase